LPNDPPILTFVIPRLNRKGGQEKSTLEVLIRLARAGWRVHVMSFVFSDWPPEVPIQWVRVPGFWVPTQILRHFWFMTYTLFKLRKRLRDPAHLVATVGMSSWFADIRVIQFLHHQLRELIYSAKAGYPNVRSPVHWLYQKIFSSWNCFLEKWGFPKTSHLIAISQSVEKNISGFWPEFKTSKKISVILHAPDHLGSNSTKQYNEIPQILFVGALERKGIKKALESLALLKHLQWVFWVVGEGNISRWKAQSKELGISDRVHFSGFQPSQTYFEKADIFLFPSQYEPFGLVVAEAVSQGLAVLASMECGATELWKNNQDWLNISALADKTTWAEALEKLIQDRDQRREIARHAFLEMNRWNWDKAAASYERVFRSTLRAKFKNLEN